MGSTQATAPAKGFIFQAYYGLYFVFLNKNYKNISSIDIEGKEEDIVIHYKDKSLDLIQVKTAEIPRKDKSFHADRFEKGLGTLLTSLNKSIADGIEVNRCIYTNNFIKGYSLVESAIKKNRTLQPVISTAHKIFSNSRMNDVINSNSISIAFQKELS